MARKNFRFMLVDLPDEDEVDASVPSECEIVKALLESRGLGSRVKHYRFTTLRRFQKPASYEYDPKFVHISGHGGDNHISLLGGDVTWTDLAEEFLEPRLTALAEGQTRILFVSTCFSEQGVDRILQLIPERFTGAYYFNTESVPFADAITAAAMFYRVKKLDRPHERVLRSINGYFGMRRLRYKSVEE